MARTEERDRRGILGRMVCIIVQSRNVNDKIYFARDTYSAVSVRADRNDALYVQ